MAAFTAPLSLTMISVGMPPGAATDCQAAQSKPGTPTSASGGMSGAAAARRAVVTPERAHLARLDQRISRREIAEHQLNMAGDDVIERGQGSLVRHMGHRDAERGFEQFAHEVMEGAGAARTVAQR